MEIIMTGEQKEGFKLSPQQRQVWDAYQNSPIYTCFSIDVDEAPDEVFFTEKLLSVVKGREIFTVHFRRMAGVSVPLQVVGPPLALHSIDLTYLPSPTVADFSAQLNKVRRINGVLTNDGIYFSVTQNPSGRATLFIGISKLHCDTHSCFIIAEQLLHALAEKDLWEDNQAIDYLDLAEWLNENLAVDSNYYDNLLINYPALSLNLRPAKTVAGDAPLQHGCLEINLSDAERDQIANFIKANNLSENTFYFTAWTLALGEISRTNRFAIGYRDTCRQFDELADVLGPLAKVVGVGVTIEDTTRFLDNYHAIQHSLEEIDVIGLPVPRDDPNKQAVFTRCGYEYNAYFSKAMLGKEESIRLGYGDSFELLLNVLHCNETVTLQLQWSNDRYDCSIANYLGEIYRNTLRFAAGLEKSIGNNVYINLLLNGSATRNPAHAENFKQYHSFIDIFEQQVRSYPNAVAIQTKTDNISYQHLNQRINRLARFLSAAGVGQGDTVAICLPRSDLLIISMFAVAKLGAAYVPIEATTPENRIAHILEDAAVHLTIASEKTAHLLNNANLLLIDQHILVDDSIDSANMDIPLDKAQLSYILYTSGSTGRPKGVLIEHGNLLNYLLWAVDFYQIGNGIGSPFFTSIGFDATITSIFPALLCGKKVVVIEDAEDLPALRAVFQSEAPFSLIKITPTHLNLLLDEFEKDAPFNTAPHYFVLGGESLSTGLAERIMRVAPNSKVVNEYGPTETVVGCMQHIYDSRYDTGAAVPIGRAITDMQVLVLDANKQVAPPGVIGEIYIAGAGVGRGYHNLTEQTENNFITLAVNGVEWRRFYRSGDLASYQLNGIIEYHGRADDQVKINGYRIELDEIQKVLDQHVAVRDCYVSTRKDEKKGKTYIYAFARLNDNFPFDPQDIKQYLRGYLPSYMLPQFIYQVAGFPLNINGKIDKQELLKLIDGHSRPAYSAPTNNLEELLTNACAKLLKTNQVGMEDSFFDLGGDSILAIQMVSALKAEGYQLNFEDIYSANSLRELAARISAPLDHSSVASSIPAFSLISPQDRHKLSAGILDAYPVTRLQLGLLFHHQLSRQSALYHDIDRIKIRGHFDLEKITTAISFLVKKHPVLRTSFHLDEYSTPLQLIHANATIGIEYLDLRSAGENSIIDPVADWIAQDKEKGFSISQPGLMRLLTVAHNDNVFQIVISRHHAILDGWSAASLMTEFMNIYSSSLDVILNVPPAVDNGFVNYVAAELNALGNQDSRNFWADSVKNSSVPLISGSFLDNKRVINHDATIKIKNTRKLPQETSEQLNLIARMLNVPVKAVFLAAHLNLISYITNNNASLSGVITHGRSGEGDQASMGLFLNTLPFPYAVRSVTWRDCILDIFSSERNMLRHRHFPIAAIVDEKVKDINILFNFVRFHVYERINKLTGFEILDIESYEATHFKLMVNVVQHPELINEFELELYFDKHEISTANIERLTDYYLHTLQALCENLDDIIHYSHLMPTLERDRLYAIAGTASGRTDDGDNLVALIERQAMANPGAIALVANGIEYSYKALNAKSNELADQISKHFDDQRHTFIGVCMDRSANLIISMLAILKAGCAYLPLDPKYPMERLNYMLSDAKPGLLLVDASNIDKINYADCNQMQVAEQHLAGDYHSLTVTRPMGESPAYIIYTSGSTGQPKGVVIRHNNALSLMRWAKSEFTATQMASMLASTSICFDLSVFEIFGPLSVGGKVVLVNSVMDIAAVAQQNISFINTVPSAMQELIAGAMLPESVNTIGLAGEPLPPDLVEKIYRHPVSHVYNLYGPSEDTTYTTFKNIVNEKAINVTIGRPLPGKRLYILDDDRALVPFGSQGELYVGGDGLAKEYFNKPDLTAQKFIIHDFGDGRIERLYNTGDIVRYNSHGDLEYLNRRDNQIKIRGHRIELGEIEHVISKVSWVEKVVVHHFDDEKRGKYLVAYIAASAPNQNSLDIKNMCKQYLPAYMCPSHVVFLEKFPLTENGKVDRKALAAPAASRGDTGKLDFEVPKTDVEKYLCTLWKNELSLAELSINDNFFEIGGNSLVLLRLHSIVSNSGKFGDCKLGILDFFNYPTIKELALYLAADPRSATESSSTIADRAMRKKQFLKNKKVLH
jgi:amino acid adenylation domain-containing protein